MAGGRQNVMAKTVWSQATMVSVSYGYAKPTLLSAIHSQCCGFACKEPSGNLAAWIQHFDTSAVAYYWKVICIFQYNLTDIRFFF